MRRLNIFVDETGDFGTCKRGSKLYGVSFTFHEQDDDISYELNKLNERLERIGYTGMIHMADLIMRRGDYKNFDIEMRKNIFKTIYHFSRKIKVKYNTIIVDKSYITNSRMIKQKLAFYINELVQKNKKYFKKFDKIVMYYDNGQETLGTILDSVFLRFNSFEHRVDFDHREKRLFQVSDMLTFIDKYDYKYRHKMSFANGEKYFFSDEEIRKIIRELNKKRF